MPEPVQLAAAGARHHLVVQRLRPAVQRPELLQREAALPPSEAAVHCLNRDVTGRAGLQISPRQHDARTGALQVTVKGLGQLEAADRSVELHRAGLHSDVEDAARGVNHAAHFARTARRAARRSSGGTPGRFARRRTGSSKHEEPGLNTPRDMLKREDLPAGLQQCGADCRLTPVGEVPRAAELGLRPSLAVPLFERDGQDAPRSDSLSRPLQDVDELLSGHVQQHCVGQHRVVRSAEVVHPDVQQPRLVTSGFEHLDERQGSVSTQDPRASALEVHRVPSGTAAEFEHGAVADQPGYLVQIRQDGWPGWRRVHQVQVRGRVVGAERDVPGLA